MVQAPCCCVRVCLQAASGFPNAEKINVPLKFASVDSVDVIPRNLRAKFDQVIAMCDRSVILQLVIILRRAHQPFSIFTAGEGTLHFNGRPSTQEAAGDWFRAETGNRVSLTTLGPGSGYR